MNGIKETFGLISEAISTMTESSNDWPYTLVAALLLLTVVAHCAIKISTLIGDNAYSRQQKCLSRLSSLRQAKENHPDVLLEAEIDAEKAKVNRYDAWCRWRQEKTQKHRNELIENKTSRRRVSFFFYSFSLLLLLILWTIPFLLKFSGLLSPEKSSILSNIKKEDLLGVGFLLAFLILPIIWIPIYIVAYRSYRAVKEANNPISIWGFSWMSTSMLFSATIAVSIETATKYTAKLLARELMLVAIPQHIADHVFPPIYVLRHSSSQHLSTVENSTRYPPTAAGFGTLITGRVSVHFRTACRANARAMPFSPSNGCLWNRMIQAEGDARSLHSLGSGPLYRGLFRASMTSPMIPHWSMPISV